jgi:2-desacetyl-2-hydroxyethyl bacteriochlorophyllide A dehydrogenase
MRAAYIEELGPPEAIRYGELEVPEPGPTDVLVEVTATTVNPVDTFVRSGLFETKLTFPFVVGRDFVGVVRAAGPGAAGFAPGDQVWGNSLGHEGRQGAAAEYAVVAADRLYRLPPDADPVELVAVAHPAATAYLGLITHGRLRPGETVLVLGAAGNVGSALVTLAAHAGARVIAVASGRDLAYCRGLGAPAAIDYREPALPHRVRELCPGGVDVILDTSGTNDLTTAVESLAPRGRVVLLAGARTRPVLPAGALYMKDGSVTGFVISHATAAELAEAAGLINTLVAGKVLRARQLEQRPLAEAAMTHRQLEDGGLRGRRVVLRVR